MRKLIRFGTTVSICLLMTTLFTTVVFAAQFVYYGGGLKNPSVEVEKRTGYPYYESVAEWQNTNTPINITTVPGSGHSYIIDGQWDDTWYGLYTPRNREFIVTGRAGKFKIELNRSTLVGESNTFRKSVIVHELGHAFCLGDNPSSGNASIMNHNRNRNYLTWPTSDDIAGVNDAYN